MIDEMDSEILGIKLLLESFGGSQFELHAPPDWMTQYHPWITAYPKEKTPRFLGKSGETKKWGFNIQFWAGDYRIAVVGDAGTGPWKHFPIADPECINKMIKWMDKTLNAYVSACNIKAKFGVAVPTIKTATDRWARYYDFSYQSFVKCPPDSAHRTCPVCSLARTLHKT
jgi:hypothetical protein